MYRPVVLCYSYYLDYFNLKKSCILRDRKFVKDMQNPRDLNILACGQGHEAFDIRLYVSDLVSGWFTFFLFFFVVVVV